MKKAITQLVVFFLTVIAFDAAGQSWNHNIDISTGSTNNSYFNPYSQQPSPLLPVGSIDGHWTVNTPNDPPGVFNPVMIGSGIREQGSGNYQTVLGNTRWISPFLNGAGEHLKSVPTGYYYYKMTFNLSMCPEAYMLPHIAFQYMKVEESQAHIFLNSVHIGTANFPLPFSIHTGNNSFPFGTLLAQGVNTIIVRVYNSQDWTGLAIAASVRFSTCATLDYELKDKDGVKKTTYCLDEDIFLDASGTFGGFYDVVVSKQTGGAYNQIAIAQGLTSAHEGINLSEMVVSQNPAALQPGNYRVSLLAYQPCGLLTLTKDFTIECCGYGPDASFSLLTGNGSGLQALSTAKGTHVWNVYGAPNINTGPYTSLAHFNTQNFSLYEGGPCYYITHKVTNACGTACAGRTACDLSCETEQCLLAAPQLADPGGRFSGSINWSTVAGSSSYVIEVFFNDPACCPGNTLGYKKTYTGTGTSYTFPPNELSMGPGSPACYSIKVYALCADGSRSAASNAICFSN